MEEGNLAVLKTVLTRWLDDRRAALLEPVERALADGLTPGQDLLESLLAAAAPEAALEAPRDTDADLGAGLDLLEDAPTQGEVLKRLLEGARRFSERAALFVIKQGIATLYAQRGFEVDQPKLGAPVVPPPELEELIHGRSTQAAPGPAYLALLGPLSRFEASAARILPLRIRHRAVALLLADSGLQEALEQPNHLRALALGAEARLGALALAREEERAARVEAPPSGPTQKILDPIQPDPPALDPAMRAAAERSARVLVGDLELYFEAKLAQGKQSGNLYGTMKDELDRSRATFVEKYGPELEDRHRIFYKTVVRLLCAGDPTRLGPAPWATR